MQSPQVKVMGSATYLDKMNTIYRGSTFLSRYSLSALIASLVNQKVALPQYKANEVLQAEFQLPP